MTVPRHPFTTSRGRGGVQGGRQEGGKGLFHFLRKMRLWLFGRLLRKGLMEDKCARATSIKGMKIISCFTSSLIVTIKQVQSNKSFCLSRRRHCTISTVIVIEDNECYVHALGY